MPAQDQPGIPLTGQEKAEAQRLSKGLADAQKAFDEAHRARAVAKAALDAFKKTLKEKYLKRTVNSVIYVADWPDFDFTADHGSIVPTLPDVRPRLLAGPTRRPQ
jgi:hypothetical protein